jgi:LAO/AO transport system kinase
MRGEGGHELWEAVLAHRRHLERTGQLAERRARRAGEELRTIIARSLEQRALGIAGGERFGALQAAVVARRTDPYQAADELIAAAG